MFCWPGNRYQTGQFAFRPLGRQGRSYCEPQQRLACDHCEFRMPFCATTSYFHSCCIRSRPGSSRHHSRPAFRRSAASPRCTCRFERTRIHCEHKRLNVVCLCTGTHFISKANVYKLTAVVLVVPVCTITVTVTSPRQIDALLWLCAASEL